MKQRVLISRTDSIGDVMLTLPMAYYIKQKFQEAEVYFLGKSYTKDIIEKCPWVDVFLNADDFLQWEEGRQVNELKSYQLDVVIFALPTAHWMQLSALAGIPKRIATGHRLSSWKWATHRLFFSRKNSDLHEAQLNLKLLSPLGLDTMPSIKELGQIELLNKTNSEKKNRLIIHPFSQGSALNWSLDQYDELVTLLEDSAFEIVVSGTQKDAKELEKRKGTRLASLPSVCGQYTLAEFIDYIGESTALLACSTGPLHLASAQGIHAIGLYVDRRPIHPGRWSPLGKHVHVVKESDVNQQMILTKPKLVAIFLKSIMERPTTKP
jgi:ADP-heptose:LPS heptosyltransferase